MPNLVVSSVISHSSGEETAILGSWEESSPGLQKTLPKILKFGTFSCFLPQMWEILPNFSNFKQLGKEKTQIFSAVRHFWSTFYVAPGRAVKYPGIKRNSQVQGMGEETLFVPRIQRGV